MGSRPPNKLTVLWDQDLPTKTPSPRSWGGLGRGKNPLPTKLGRAGERQHPPLHEVGEGWGEAYWLYKCKMLDNM